MEWTSGGGRKAKRVTGISCGERRKTASNICEFYSWRWKSGGGPPHSETLRVHEGNRTARSVLECASPLALWAGRVEAAGKLEWTSGDGGRKVGRVTGISGGEMRETDGEQPIACVSVLFGTLITRKKNKSYELPNDQTANVGI